MAWSPQKNEVFFSRVQNWAAAVVNLLEERDRLIALYTNEASGDVAFVNTSIATTQEVVDIAGVMNALDAMVNGTAAVSQLNRMPLLTPFLANQV